MRRRWNRDDDADLRRLRKKAGGTAALLKRLERALKNKPRHGGRRKNAVSAQSQYDDFLRSVCELNKRTLGTPYRQTLEWYLKAPERARNHAVRGGLTALKLWRESIRTAAPENMTAGYGRKLIAATPR
jgi:hypothetical protein